LILFGTTYEQNPLVHANITTAGFAERRVSVCHDGVSQSNHWRFAVDTFSADAVGTAGDQIGPFLASDDGNGRGEEILASANFPGGLGGYGQRHWVSDGTNNHSGGLLITLGGSFTEIWVRFYVRFQSGFKWLNNSPHYQKMCYFNNDHVFGLQPGSSQSWGLDTQAGTTAFGSVSWSDMNGGVLGDGQFHCIEFHLKQNGANGQFEIWVDDVQALDTTLNLGSTPYTNFIFPSNQNEIVDSGEDSYYFDLDDVVVSDSGRIGTIEGEGATTFFQTIAATAIGVATLATLATHLRTLAATAVGTAALATVTTFARTLAATSTGAVGFVKGVFKTLAATAAGSATLSATSLITQVVSTAATGAASLAAQFIEGAGTAAFKLATWLIIALSRRRRQ